MVQLTTRFKAKSIVLAQLICILYTFMMRPLRPSAAVLLVLMYGSVITHAGDFSSVPGTGWTDVSQLQSTCHLPGYFVNPSDCSRFYVCADHSTPEHRLLLRYDFDCPAGLAFDEPAKICNYPGPTGCISPGGSSGGGGGWGGWSKPSKPGIWQSTATVSRVPSWGTPTKFPVGGSSAHTLIHSSAPTGTTVVPQSPLPPNPRISIPISGVPEWESFRIHPGQNEVFQSVKVSQVPSGGWGATKVVPIAPGRGTFQSVKVTEQGPGVAWGTSKVLPVTPSVVHPSKVNQIPAEWPEPKPFPPPPKVFQHSKGVDSSHVNVGWESTRITGLPAHAPVPANPSLPSRVVVGGPAHGPIQANPSVPGRVIGAPPPISPTASPHAFSWQNTKFTQGPSQVVWNSPPHPSSAPFTFQGSPNPVPANPSFTFQGNTGPVHASFPIQENPPPANPSFTFQETPVPANPSFTIHGNRAPVNQPFPFQGNPVPANPSFTFQGNPAPANPSYAFQGNPVPANPSYTFQGNPVPANPSLNLEQGGWDNVKITQIPSGYAWQTTNSVSHPPHGHQQTVIGSPPAPGPTLSTHLQPPAIDAPLSSGNFGIVQQVIDEAENQQPRGQKSHIQRIYEQQEKLNPGNAVVTSQIPAEIAANPSQFSGPVYEVSSPGSGVRGRIIVLYAPYTKGSKRDLPVVEVEVSDKEDEEESQNQNNENEE